MSKLVFEHAISSSLGSIRYRSVSTGTEPNLPILNTLGTEFIKEPIGTDFWGTEFTRVPENRTDRFGIYRMPSPTHVFTSFADGGAIVSIASAVVTLVGREALVSVGEGFRSLKSNRD
jgi:hypothetical protein